MDDKRVGSKYPEDVVDGVGATGQYCRGFAASSDPARTRRDLMEAFHIFSPGSADAGEIKVRQIEVPDVLDAL